MPAKRQFEIDTIPTRAGDLSITFLGHGTLMFTFEGLTIHVDPYGEVADYSELPQADLILITHEHFDHMDPAALAAVRRADTDVVLTEAAARQTSGGIVMHNGDRRSVRGLVIEAAPAYNVVHTRENGQPFHPYGSGNGYIVTFGDKRVYVAGDTENVREIKRLRDIDVAFLPMNLPYTMSPEMVADVARTIQPKILYPYHFGDTDTGRLVQLLQGEPDIEVRIRQMA